MVVLFSCLWNCIFFSSVHLLPSYEIYSLCLFFNTSFVKHISASEIGTRDNGRYLLSSWILTVEVFVYSYVCSYMCVNIAMCLFTFLQISHYYSSPLLYILFPYSMRLVTRFLYLYLSFHDLWWFIHNDPESLYLTQTFSF